MRKTALLAALALSGCATAPPIPKTITVTQDIYVPWAWPAVLQSCARDPAPLPVPRIVAADPHAASQIARNVLELRAHDAASVAVANDCRDTLAAAVAANRGAQ